MTFKFHSYFLGVNLIVLILVLSCNSKVEEQETNPVKSIFYKEIANGEFVVKNPQLKWDYLLNSLKVSYENSAEYQDWFLEKFNTLKEEDYTPEEEVIRGINEILLGFQYFKIGKAFAEYTLQNKDLSSFVTSQNLAYNHKVHYFIFNKQIDSADKYLKILDEEIGEDSYLPLSLSYFNKKAERAALEGKIFEAVVNFKRALDLVPKEDFVNRFMFHLSIAGLYNDFEFNEKAKYHVDMAYKLIPLDSIPEKYLNTMGIIESKSGNFERANQIFSRALGFGIKTGRPEILAPVYSNYSTLRRREKKYDEALEFASKSDSICGVYGLTIGFLINQINRAEIYYDQSKYNEALNELELAYPDLNAFNILNFNMAYYESLYKTYDGLGMKALADDNYRKFNEFQKDYLGDISRSAISEWELSTERELAEKNLNIYNLELKRQMKIKYLIALLFTILLLGLSIIYFFRYNKRRMERERFRLEGIQLRQELENKSKELLTESLNNLTVQNTKEEILGELEKILNQLPEKVRSRFSVFNQKLKSGRESNFLEEFETRFKGVYESFYQKLLKQAPDLTPNDLRVCAFIRLNISSKDIARLTGKSLGTIDNNKTLIRKKLNLSSDNNLQKYLMNL